MAQRWKEVKPMCDDLWYKLTSNVDTTHHDQDSAYLSRSDWDNVLMDVSIDMNATQRADLFNSIISMNLMKNNHNQTYIYSYITKTVWMNYWQKSLDSPYWIKFKQLHHLLLENINRNSIPNNKLNALCCYQWRLPQYNLLDLQLLFYGWIRIKLMISKLFIPIDIFQICMHYFYAYNHNIDRIKKCKPTKSALSRKYIRSGTFTYKSCKFHFQIRERSDICDVTNDMEIHIHLLYKPDHIAAVTLNVSIGFMEKFIVMQIPETGDFKFIDAILVCRLNVSRDDIQYLDSLTFNCFLNRVSAVNYRGETIFEDTLEIINEGDGKEVNLVPTTNVPESVELSDNTDRFIWRISQTERIKIQNAKPKHIVTSEIFVMFGMKWQIWLFVCYIYPNIATQHNELYHNNTAKWE